jgi:hypothetical protein
MVTFYLRRCSRGNIFGHLAEYLALFPCLGALHELGMVFEESDVLEIFLWAPELLWGLFSDKNRMTADLIIILTRCSDYNEGILELAHRVLLVYVVFKLRL